MEKDRVFELLKQGDFKVKYGDRIYSVNCLRVCGKETDLGYYDFSIDYNDLSKQNDVWYNINCCKEIVPWVDKYKDVIENLCGKYRVCEEYANKIITEIETLHNKGKSDE